MQEISEATNRTRAAGGRLFEQPYLLLSLTSLFWAGNAVVGRMVAGHVPPMTLAFVRWAGGFAILLPFAFRPLCEDWPIIRRHPVMLTLLAFTGFSAFHAMTYYGLQYTTAINGLLLQSVCPLFVALWTFLLFGERVSMRQALGVSISLLGVVVIVCHGTLEVLLQVAFNRGDMWFVIALLIYALYTAVLRQRPAVRPISFLAVGMGWGAVMLIPAVAIELALGRTVTLDGETVLTFAYVCLFPGLLGYLFLNRGVEMIGANRAAPFIHLVPVFGSVLAIVLLGERFELYHAAGYALALTGITVATAGRR
jgi:drug/metabolite transporter (DMT)-like permease